MWLNIKYSVFVLFLIEYISERTIKLSNHVYVFGIWFVDLVTDVTHVEVLTSVALNHSFLHEEQLFACHNIIQLHFASDIITIIDTPQITNLSHWL